MTLGRLVRGLAARECELLVIRPERRDEILLEDADSPFEEYILPGYPLPGYAGLRFGQPCIWNLYSKWKQCRPDVVHIATEGPLGMAALLVAKCLGICVTSTFHTNFHQYGDHYRYGFLKSAMLGYLRWFHNRFACTLAPTRQMADELEKDGFERTGVLSRGVDTELFSPEKRCEALRSSWGVEREDRVFIFVGRVAAEKNIQLAVEAYEAARGLDERSRMVVVGDGPETKRLKALYPDVIFAGMQRGEDLAKHYASGDVFLFPSVTETFGNVVTEAMSSGLAVVTYDYAAGREYVRSGVSGLLAAFNDQGDFFDKAQEAWNLGNGALVEMRAKARETAAGISWERVIDDFRTTLYAMRESVSSADG